MRMDLFSTLIVPRASVIRSYCFAAAGRFLSGIVL